MTDEVVLNQDENVSFFSFEFQTIENGLKGVEVVTKTSDYYRSYQQCLKECRKQLQEDKFSSDAVIVIEINNERFIVSESVSLLRLFFGRDEGFEMLDDIE